jgi:hypothetical protein
MTIEDYLNLITWQYQNSVNYIQMVALSVMAGCQVQFLMQQMQSVLFNLQTPPVGDQLDIIGEWVGISRQIATPLQGIFFSWDDTFADGWDSGSWQPPGNPTQIVELPDSAYFNLILAKIAANMWDGSTQQFYQILDQAFPGYQILLVDYQDMSYSLGIIGYPVDALTLSIFTGGYIPVRPEGVQVVSYFTNTESEPVFGWDSTSGVFAGWDTGYWVTTYAAS